jgi:predicted nucleic acid-binding protein
MGLSCLTDPTASIVLDASTAINLNATGYAAAILRALPNRAVITDIALNELREDQRTGRRDGEAIADLVKSSLIAVAPLAEPQERDFESLVVGRGIDTLDDGEAATIAYAAEAGAIAVIDERKANRICAARYPQVHVGCTIDLLAHAAVEGALGAAGLADAVFDALQQARMRVLPQHLDWVVTLIGQDRAQVCPSLPRIVRVKGGSLAETR